MENTAETQSWHSIIGHYPEWTKNYHDSAASGLDKLANEYRQLVNGRTTLSGEDSTNVLFSLGRTQRELGRLTNEEILRVQGRGMYYALDAETIEFLDGTPGVSGYFTGLQIDELPLYHEMVYKKEMLYRPLLCIALEGYSLHNADNTPGIFVDDTIIIPIIGQDLCVTHYNNSFVV